MPDRDELTEIIAELSLNASDRASAILGAAVLDGALESVILPKFRKLTEAQIKELFGPDSPLGTFSAKIRIGYALNLYGPKTRSDLDSIREVRNAFAQTRKRIYFSTKEVRTVVDRIQFSKRLLGQAYNPQHILGPKEHYALACTFLIVYFNFKGKDEKAYNHRPDWLNAIAS